MTDERQLYPRMLRAALAMTRQCWEQGMLSYALLRCGENELLDLVVHDMVLRQSVDGRLCNVENTPAVTDSAFCIPAVWARGPRAAAERNVDFLLNGAERAEDGTLFHMRGTGEVWADSAAFLPFALAISGHAEAAVGQMDGILSRLYLPGSGLYAHIWDERAQSFIDARPWGVGDGWILTGLLRTALALDGRDPLFPLPRRTELAAPLYERFRALLARMLDHMTPGFTFRDALDDPASFEESETAAMVACCLYRGMRVGVLGAELKETAENIRRGVLARTDASGLVRGAASSPAFDRPGTSVECQAHMLMMERLRAAVSDTQTSEFS